MSKVTAYLFYIGEDYYVYRCYYPEHLKYDSHSLETPHGSVDEKDLD